MAKEAKLDKALTELEKVYDAFYQKVMDGDVKGALERGVWLNKQAEEVIKVMTGTEVK